VLIEVEAVDVAAAVAAAVAAVAAEIAAAAGAAAAAAAAAVAAAEEAAAEENKCNICWDNEKTHAFYPCGHQCACESCAHAIMDDTAVCPMCQSNVEGSMRVYVT
jgi:hypothetical protein